MNYPIIARKSSVELKTLNSSEDSENIKEAHFLVTDFLKKVLRSHLRPVYSQTFELGVE